jgi:membrane-bound lytic murein transglycosylase D
MIRQSMIRQPMILHSVIRHSMLRQPMICFFQEDGPERFAIETGVGMHVGSRRSFTAAAGRLIILMVAAAALFGLSGCEDAARHTAVNHPVPPPAAAPKRNVPAQGAPARTIVRVDLLPLPAVGRVRVLLFPLRPPDGAQRVEQQVREELAAAQQDYQAGNVETARREFERALELLVESGFDLRVNPRLAALQQQIVEAERNAETVAANGDSFSTPKTAPAPMDEIAASAAAPGAPAEAPVDPLLRTRAEGELAAVPHDLPLVVNDVVLSFLNFFQTTRGRAIVETGLRRAGRYRPMIERVLQEEGLPSDLMYMAQAESAFQPQALSREGARGLWQFMSFRGKEYGLEHSWWVDDRQDPEKATRAAAHHLRDLYKMFGDWYLAMAAYDSGPGTVQHAVEHTGYADFWQLYKLNALPKETRNYVPIIVALTLIAKDPVRYGMDVDPEEPLHPDNVLPGHPVDLRLVAETLDVDVETLRMLNPQLLRLVTPADPAFVLHLPQGSGDRFYAEMSAIPEDKWASWRRHVVAEGETLSEIGQQYHVSAAAIAGVNALETRGPLEPGVKLIIPVPPQSPASPGKLLRYRGRLNDTVESVADEFDVNAADLRKWNHLRGNQAVHNLRLKIYLGGSGAPGTTARDDSNAKGNGDAGKAGARSPGAASAARKAAPVPEFSANAANSRTTSVTKLAASSSAGAARTSPARPAEKVEKVEKQNPAALRASVKAASAQPVVHRVKPGETLYSIARNYQTTVEALRSGNRFLLNRSLEAGDTLRIPAIP